MAFIYDETRKLWLNPDGSVLGGDESEDNGYDRETEYQSLVDLGVIQDDLGRYGKGNIDLYNRPKVKNDDGSISTIRSMSFEEDGKNILIPTVSDDGRIMSDEEAIEAYHTSGNHLGMFSNADEADEYAKKLHEQQQNFYNFDIPQEDTEGGEEDVNGLGHPYQKLTVGETLLDMAKAVGWEASKVLFPKRGGWADQHLPSWYPREHIYDTKTHAAENTAGITEFLTLLAGCALPGGAFIKGGQLLTKAPALVKGFKGFQAAMKGQEWYTKIGAFLFTEIKSENKFVKHILAPMLDLTALSIAGETMLARPERGENSPFAGFDWGEKLAVTPDDSTLKAKLKIGLGNTAIGMPAAPVIGPGLNAAIKYGIAPVFRGAVKAWGKFVKNPSDTAAKAAVDAARAQMDNTAKGTDLILSLREAREKAKASPDEERYIKDFAHAHGYNEDLAWEVYSKMENGHEIIPNADGSFSVKVTKWQDAAEVTAEELAQQTDNDGIILMNEAVRDTWHERGILAEGEEIIKVDEKTGKVKTNQKAANRVTDYYREKFEIQNNVKVQYVDGQIKGADGNTTVSQIKGKKAKSKTAVQKLKNQISKKEKLIIDLNRKLEGKDINRPLDHAQKLHQAFEELKVLKQDLASLENPEILPEITILINKNAENPYAVLRSELEHARDIAKGEVPNQAERHFSRYEGINESEMSLRYVKKKADTRRGQTATQAKLKADGTENNYVITTVTDPDLPAANGDITYNILRIENKEGITLGHIRYSDIGDNTLFIDMMENYKVKKGLVRTGVAKLLADNPNKKVYWQAVTEESINSYKQFCKEYPDFVNRVIFEDRTKIYNIDEIIDDISDFSYNREKGDVHARDNKLSTDNQRREDMGTGGTANHTETNEHTNREAGSPDGVYVRGGNEKGVLSESNTTINERGKTPDISSRGKDRPDSLQQSNGGSTETRGNQSAGGNQSSGTTGIEASAKTAGQNIDYSKPVSEQLSSAETMGDVDAVVNNVLENSEELNKMDWTSIAKDADELFRKIGSLAGGDNTVLALKQAFAANDINHANLIVRKVMAASRVFGDLTQQAKIILNEKGDPAEIYKALTFISQYISDISSAFGGGLNAMKFKNKALKFFSLTTLEQQGMDNLADLLHKSFEGLNFTQSVKTNLQLLYKDIQGYGEGKFWNYLMSDEDLAKAFDEGLRRILANADGSGITSKEIRQFIKRFTRETAYKGAEKIIKNSPDIEAQMNWFRKSMNIAKQTPQLYVSSILTSPLTHFRNIISGTVMTLYKPLAKMAGGAVGRLFRISDDGMIKEGVNTYHYLFGCASTWREAWKMAAHAFKTGEGVLTGMGHESSAVNSSLEGLFKFNELGKSDAPLAQKLMDLLTISSRLMGAEDEFLTQLNYRAMARAKAAATAERQADTLGLTGIHKAKYMEEKTDELFKAAFDVEGRAADVSLYASTREITFQGDLSGKYYDPLSGSKVQLKDQSLLMSVGEFTQNLVRKHPEMKFIFPFVRTPVNIGQFYAESTGLLAWSQRELLKSASREGAEARGKLALGLLSLLSAWGLAANNLITGSAPPDSKTREKLLKTGWRPYSIHINDKYYSYQGLDPAESLFALGADAFTLWNAFDPDSYEGTRTGYFFKQQLRTILGRMIETSSFSSSISELDNLMQGIENGDEEFLEKFLARKVRGVIPFSSAGNYIGNLMHPEQTKPEGFKEILTNKFFLADAVGDYRRNYFGERMDVYYTCGLFPTSEEQDYPEDLEIQRLTEEGWQPSELSSRDNTYGLDFRKFRKEGETQTMHDLMLETMSEIKLEGKTLREAVRELISSEDYQLYNDGISIEEQGTSKTKINELKKLFKRYKDAAKDEVIKRTGKEYVNKDGVNAFDLVNSIRVQQEENARNARVEDLMNDLSSFWIN